MSGLFDARCGVPVFMMETEDIARRCGRFSGMITAGFFTLIIIIITIIQTININNEKDENGDKKHKSFVWWPILVGIICIILVWIFIPMLSGYFNAATFRFKKEEMKSMERRGLNQQDIFKQQQSLYEKRMETDARIRSAQIQANAMRDAFRRD